jgi:hypothetical protein
MPLSGMVRTADDIFIAVCPLCPVRAFSIDHYCKTIPLQ